MSEERRHALIVNPSSGGGRGGKALPDAERLLRDRGISFHTVVSTDLGHGIEGALAAHDAGEIPVVMSGDGLVGQVGGALAERGATMGILPGGRGNDLARVLGIPSNLAGATEVLAAGHEREIDVGEANGRRFLCVASIGFESVANEYANTARILRGGLVYAYAGVRTLASWKPARFDVTFDGDDRIEFEGYSVSVANSRAFGGGFFIAPHAELDDAVFDVVMVGQGSKLRFLSGMPEAKKGTHIERDSVQVQRAARVEVSADRPFAVYADGEHLTDLPAKLRVLPRALRVLSPPGPLGGPDASHE